MKLSIVIVNYNGKRFFDGCFSSIAEHVPFKHEVIVVDNASTDGSVEYLRDRYPKVRLVDAGQNLGFSRGNNLGVNLATGKYILLLNNDTLLMDDLCPAIKVLESDDSVGVLGVRMLDKKKKYRYSAGHFPEPWRLVKFSWLYQLRGAFRCGLFPKDENYYSVDWIEGSFLLTPAIVWNNVGGLDESYFMYVEDIDYARKVVNMGKKVAYFPKISYVHFGGYSQPRIGMLVNGFRNYHKKHSNWVKRLFANLVLDTGLLLRSVVYLFYSLVKASRRERVLLCLRALKRMK